VTYLTTKGIDGRPFTVRIVREGDGYGRDDCLTHDEADPLVEFYDASQDSSKFGLRGQFVSRYYLSTLLEPPTDRGLGLEGSVPAWTIPEQEFSALIAVLSGLEAADDTSPTTGAESGLGAVSEALTGQSTADNEEETA